MLEDVINENLVSIPSALSTGRSGVCIRAWEKLSTEEGHLALTSATGQPAPPGAVCEHISADADGPGNARLHCGLAARGPGLCHVRPSHG